MVTWNWQTDTLTTGTRGPATVLFCAFFVYYFIAGSVATVDQAATLLPFVSVVNLV